MRPKSDTICPQGPEAMRRLQMKRQGFIYSLMPMNVCAKCNDDSSSICKPAKPNRPITVNYWQQYLQ